MLSFLPSSVRRCSIRSMKTRFPQDITRWPRAMMVLWNSHRVTTRATTRVSTERRRGATRRWVSPFWRPAGGTWAEAADSWGWRGGSSPADLPVCRETDSVTETLAAVLIVSAGVTHTTGSLPAEHVGHDVERLQLHRHVFLFGDGARQTTRYLLTNTGS